MRLKGRKKIMLLFTCVYIHCIQNCQTWTNFSDFLRASFVGSTATNHSKLQNTQVYISFNGILVLLFVLYNSYHLNILFFIVYFMDSHLKIVLNLCEIQISIKVAAFLL